MRLCLLFGWFLHTSNAFTHPGFKGGTTTGRLLHVQSNYDRRSPSSSLIYSTTTSNQQQLLNNEEDTTEFIQKNIEIAATTTDTSLTTAEPDNDDDTIISTSSSTTTRFDRVVGPKHALIYDTPLRGMLCTPE